MNANEATPARTRLGPAVQIGVILLALLAGGIHLYIWLIEGILSGLPQEQQMGPTYQFLFVGNFFGYVTLAAALYLPVSLLTRVRPVVRVLLIAMSMASIASYFHVGFYDTLGNATQVIVALLIALVTVDADLSTLKERDEGGRDGWSVVGAITQLVVGLAIGIVMFFIILPLI